LLIYAFGKLELTISFVPVTYAGMLNNTIVILSVVYNGMQCF